MSGFRQETNEDNTMIISHVKRLVMLVPWKTASSTLHTRFAQLNESPYSRFYYFSEHLNRVTHQHATCAEFAQFPESKLGYSSAVFVRNPYDRVYSAFIQVQRDINNQPRAHFAEQWIKDLVVKHLHENHVQLQNAEYEFDKWLASLNEYQVLAAGCNSSLPLHPCHYWTHLAGVQLADFVGRVEQFELDIERLCKYYGLAPPAEVNENVSDRISGSAPAPQGYRHVNRMSRRSIEKINWLFQKDFELFGYVQL